LGKPWRLGLAYAAKMAFGISIAFNAMR